MAEKLPLKALRALKDLTQKQTADAIPVDIKTYVKWEKGESYPNIQQVYKLAELFGCEIDDIFFAEKVR